MSGSIGYAIRAAKGSLSLDRLRQQYPGGPPDSLKARARDIGWSEACGWRLSGCLGRDDIPHLLSIAIGMVVSEVDEFVRAAVNARLTLPERLSPGDLLKLTLPAAVEARGLGMPVEDFAEYVHVSCGRIPAGALTAGVPAECAAVL